MFLNPGFYSAYFKLDLVLILIFARLIWTLRSNLKDTLKNLPYFFRVAEAPEIF